MFTTHRRTIIAFAKGNNLPFMSPENSWPVDGGLLSYGADFIDHSKRMATYVHDLASQPTGRMVNALTWSHWGLGLVGFVGMVGWLPTILSGLVNSLTAFAKAISDWLASKLAK